jgi:hypothetical protein
MISPKDKIIDSITGKNNTSKKIAYFLILGLTVSIYSQ